MCQDQACPKVGTLSCDQDDQLRGSDEDDAGLPCNGMGYKPEGGDKCVCDRI